VLLTFFCAGIADFGALLVKSTNPFVAGTQHIGGGKADNCAFMIELNASDALSYFRGMQTFEAAVVANDGAGETGIYTFFKTEVFHF